MDRKSLIELDASHFIDEDSGTPSLPSVTFKILDNHTVKLLPGYYFPMYEKYDGYIIGNSQADIRIPEYLLINGEKYKVTAIGHGAFWGCLFIKSVFIPKSIKQIVGKVFECYPPIVNIYPDKDGLKDMHIWTSQISKINVSINNTTYDSRDNCNAIIETATNTLIVGCKNTIIPHSVKNIAPGSFLTTDFNEITIDSNIVKIDPKSFAGCGYVESIKVSETNNYYDSRNNCNALIETGSNTLVRGCKMTTIPKGIKSIGDYAFHCVYDLKTIVIPDGVESIGNHSFNSCFDLEHIELPESVLEIGDEAFFRCYSLKSMIIKNTDTLICKSAFSDSRVLINGKPLYDWPLIDNDSMIYDDYLDLKLLLSAKWF